MIEAAEEVDEDVPEEEEPPERRYTTLNTSVVGVQYYKGDTCHPLGCAPRTNVLDRTCRIRRTSEARSGAEQPI